VERSADGVTGWTPVGNTLVPGDANGDGVVNFADFVNLSNHYGQFGGWSEGDFNGDWTVNFADFVAMSNHYGMTFDGTGAAGLTFHDAGVTAGQTYYYRVWAGFAGGTTGGASEPVGAVAGGTAPEEPVVNSSANMVVAPAAVSGATTAATNVAKTADHVGKTKVGAAREAMRAEQRVWAARAQWWWGWWRNVSAWMVRAR
jgi:hypothetical protein